jgi:hypothetical protein
MNVTVNAGDGDDTIVVGAGNLSTFLGNVSVIGGNGTDSLDISDINATGNDSYDVSSTLLTKSDWGNTLRYTQLENHLLQAGNDNNTITMTSSFDAWIIEANGGADFIDVVGNQFGTSVTVRGGAGNDTIRVNNDELGIASVTLDQSDVLGDIQLFEGSRLIVAPNGSTVIDTSSTGFLRGTLDLTDNMMIVRSPAVAFVVDKLNRGFNGGGWNGVPAGGVSGVVLSSTAAASARTDGVGYAVIGGGAGQLNQAVVGGQAVLAGNMVLRYTLAGDTDLDRTVGFADLLSLAQNYDPNVGGRNWLQGNFTYNNADNVAGATGFTDLLQLAQNYGVPFLSGLSSRAISERRIFSQIEIAA